MSLGALHGDCIQGFPLPKRENVPYGYAAHWSVCPFICIGDDALRSQTFITHHYPDFFFFFS